MSASSTRMDVLGLPPSMAIRLRATLPSRVSSARGAGRLLTERER
jgi:hypothetical protein